MSITNNLKHNQSDSIKTIASTSVSVIKELYHKALEGTLDSTFASVSYPSGDTMLYIHRPTYVSGTLSVGIKVPTYVLSSIEEIVNYMETALQSWNPTNIQVDGCSIRMEFQPSVELRDIIPHTRPKPYEEIKARMPREIDFNDIIKETNDED